MFYRYLLVAVLSFGAGVAVMDQRQQPQLEACAKERQQAQHFATAIANILNGGGLETDDVRVSCRVTPIRRTGS